MQDDARMCVDDEPLRWYDDEHGEGSARRILEQAAPSSSRITAYLRRLEYVAEGEKKPGDLKLGWMRPANVQLNPERMGDHARRMRSITGDEVIHEIQTKQPDQDRFWYTSWGRHAPVQELGRVATAMFNESHPGRLLKYLRVFRRRALPAFDTRLLDLTDHKDKAVRESVVHALANTAHPMVRQLALTCIGQGEVTQGQLKLLEHNYFSGDERLIKDAIFLPGDREYMHSMLHELVEVFEANRVAEAEDLMLFVYEHSPCGNCRHRAMKVLLDINRAPQWVLSECGYDAQECIRKALAT
jgi:hypothetical protein